MLIELEQFVDDTKLEKKKVTVYLDGYLKLNLDVGIKALHNDFDQVWMIDGPEGSGKSSIAQLLAYYVSPMERRHSMIDRIINRIEDAEKIIKDAQPFDSIIIDEAYGGMSSANFVSKLNKVLQRLFTEIRAKNLFIFILAPTFMDISKYFAIWRTKCLISTYLKEGKRSYASFYSEKRKRKLYILGKKHFYDYYVVKPNFRFRFQDAGDKIMDKALYKERKRIANLDSGDKPVEDRVERHNTMMKECWTKVLANLKTLPLKITQETRAKLIEMSIDSIQRYEKEAKKGIRIDLPHSTTADVI